MLTELEGNAGLRTVLISDGEHMRLIQKLLLQPRLQAALLGLQTSCLKCSHECRVRIRINTQMLMQLKARYTADKTAAQGKIHS